LDISAVEQLVKMLQQSDVSELEIAAGGMCVKLKRGYDVEPDDDDIIDVDDACSPGPDESQLPKAVEVRAQMVGIFRLLDDKVPGAAVVPKQAVGLIESMKLMNEVSCDAKGIIEQIYVEDGSPVEYGQLLLTVVGDA